MPLDNAIDGAGAAPGSYTILAQNSTSLVQGGGNVVDAVTLQVQENTFGVWFQVTVTRAAWNLAAGIAAAGAGSPGAGTAALQTASEYAALIQALAGLPPVTAMSYQQNTNAQGLLVDQLLVTVTSPDGLSNIDVTVPLDPAKETTSNNAIMAAAAGITTVAANT